MEVLLCLLALLVVVIVVHLFFILYDELPGPVALPVVGNVWSIINRLHDLHHQVNEHRTLYGKVYRTWFFFERVLNVFDPEGVKQMLSSKYEIYDRSPREQEMFEELLGGGMILESNGNKWKRMRELLLPAFSKVSLKQLTHLFVHRAEILINIIDKRIASSTERVELDMQSLFQNLTFDIVGLFAIGIDFQSQSETKKQFDYDRAWEHMLKHLTWRALFPFSWWKIYKTQDFILFDKELKMFEDAIFEAIRTKTNETSEEQSRNKQYPCLLNILLEESAKPGGDWITPVEMRNELLTFLFAGHDTTTNTLCWTLYYLAKYPDVLERVRQEVDEQIVNTQEWSWLFLDLNKLRYLKCVIKEALRLHPSAPLRGRTVIQDDVLLGHKVKKKTSVGWSSYVMHHDPELWESPKDFKPERFLEEQGRHGYQFIPFGAGPRRCIGEHFALNEITLVIAMLTNNFDFAVTNEDKVQEEFSLTMRLKYGLLMHLQKRSSEC